MPKAAIHKDGNVVSRKYQVWFAGQIGAMQPVSKPHAKQQLADDDFRFGILGANPGHHPTACILVDDVSHWFRRAPFAFVRSVATCERGVSFSLMDVFLAGPP